MEPKKLMLFIDGENITLRYQSMIDQGYSPQKGVIHERDTYVWHSHFHTPAEFNVVRSYYYTSIIGDTKKITEIQSKIKTFQVKSMRTVNFSPTKFHTYESPLYPVVFKKAEKSRKTKLVDIKMVVDILTHVYQDNVDAIYILSGDGDFEEVIKEVVRKGKQVILGAFPNGLSPSLKAVADEFVGLESRFLDMNTGPAA